jgi:hypothetical protein
MSTKRTATRAVEIAAPAKGVRPKKKPAGDDILVDIRADIIQWHVAAEQSAVEARIAIGGKLVEAKERIEHGAFARWVEEHLPSPAEALTREARQATTRLKHAVDDLLEHADSTQVDLTKVTRIRNDLLKMAKRMDKAFALAAA